MFMKYLAPLAGVFALALSCIAPAQARDDGTDHSVTLEKVVQAYTVQADGSFQLDVETVTRINEERAIQAKAQQPLSYNRSFETLEVVEAFTRKPDGRTVKVEASQIKEQQEQASSFAPMFQDSRVKVVIFPEVAIGDQLVLRYKLQRTTALFPGQFEDITAPDFHPVKQFTLSYDLPADMPLYADARGFKASAPKVGKGRKVHRWDFVPTERARTEAGSVSYLDYGQYLAVSTFKEYSALATAYQARAGVEVTPAIAALAGELTANLPGAREKAFKLSDWVRENIRYVAVYVGPGGVVPHSAQSVLDNRYGDCKDHVALLEALLRAAGIESSPALINLGNAYTLPKVPTLGVLNHVLTYIPSLDLYLDSTDPSIAAGYLPLPDLDKPVLLTASGVLGKTPASQLNKQSGEMLFKVQGTGAADFTSASVIEGWASEFSRYSAKSMKPADLDRIVEQVLNAYGQRGSGKILIQPSLAPEHFRSTVEGRTENLVNLPGPVGVQAFSSLVGGIAQTVYGFAAENERTQAFICLTNEAVEQSRFEFPAEVTILATPKPVAVQNASFDYSARYTRDGNAVVIERRLRFKHPKAVCTPEEFKVMKPSIETMVKDLQGQIIVQAS